MSTEIFLKGGDTTHWPLGNFGVTACGELTTVSNITIAETVYDLNCPECLRYAAKTDENIFQCGYCDRCFLGFEERNLHQLSHED